MSEPLDALQIVCRDRDVWKQRAEALQVQLDLCMKGLDDAGEERKELKQKLADAERRAEEKPHSVCTTEVVTLTTSEDVEAETVAKVVKLTHDLEAYWGYCGGAFKLTREALDEWKRGEGGES